MTAAIWPDSLVDQVLASLQAAVGTSGITGLDTTKILDGDMLPTDLADLPIVGVYIPDDKDNPQEPDTDGAGNQHRIATIRVEVRGIGTSIRSATKDLRKWVLKTLMADETLGGTAFNLRFSSCTFWGKASEKRMGGADLDFEAFYLFNRSAT